MSQMVTATRTVIRRARPADAEALVDFVEFASEGLVHRVWAAMAEPGESLRAVGLRRARREKGDFSYKKAFLAEDAEGIAAGMIGYALPEAPEPQDLDSLPPLFRPLLELELLAPGSWYVNVLATYPGCRGQGFGTALLEEADRLAADSGCRQLSIIVSDGNPGARRLYERHGFRERARRPMVKEGWENPGENWVLLVKDLPARAA